MKYMYVRKIFKQSSTSFSSPSFQTINLPLTWPVLQLLCQYKIPGRNSLGIKDYRNNCLSFEDVPASDQ